MEQFPHNSYSTVFIAKFENALPTGVWEIYRFLILVYSSDSTTVCNNCCGMEWCCGTFELRLDGWLGGLDDT